MRIIGVDPGTNVMGIGIVDDDPYLTLIHVEAHTWGRKQRTDRLANIAKTIEEYLVYYKPDVLAIEDQYVGINKRGSLHLAGAKDIVITEATKKGVPVFEYAPSTIKKAVAGHGGASKELVALCVKAILNMRPLPMKHDASDALAIAICHSHKAKTSQYMKAWK